MASLLWESVTGCNVICQNDNCRAVSDENFLNNNLFF